MQGHHQMHIFLKCIFTCRSTSTTFEYSSGTSTNISSFFSWPQNNIIKFKRTGYNLRGFCCIISLSWGSPSFQTVSQLLRHLLSSLWALLNGPNLLHFPSLERASELCYCSRLALQLMFFSKSNLLFSLDAKITSKTVRGWAGGSRMPVLLKELSVIQRFQEAEYQKLSNFFCSELPCFVHRFD